MSNDYVFTLTDANGDPLVELRGSTDKDNGDSKGKNSLLQSSTTTSPSPDSATGRSTSCSSSSSEEEEEEESGPPETSSLLPPHEEGLEQTTTGTSARTPLSTTKNTLGWTFASPFWCLSSSYLLKITYRPDWQALPDYTRKHAPGICRRYCCCPSSSRRRQTHKYDVWEEIYTTKHVHAVEPLKSLHIRGVGACRAVRLLLRWQQQQQHDDKNDDGQQLQQALRHQATLPPHQTHDWEITSEFADTLPPLLDDNDNNNNERTIALIFAMPLDPVHPPLLWKLQLPPMPGVAVETYTVLEGALHILPLPQPHRPTHIYLEGYQSWSFSGSVAQQDPQPKSAMPNVFSKAFNQGAAPPPEVSVDVVQEEEEDDNDEDEWRENNHATTTTATTTATTTHHDDNSNNKEEEARFYQSDFFTCLTSDGHVDPQPVSRLPHLLKRATTSGLKQSTTQNTPQHHRRLLDETGGPALLLGWLAQHHHFGLITVDRHLQRVAMHAAGDATLLSNKSIYTDWAYAELIAPHTYDEEPMVHYLHAVAAYNEARPLMNGPLLTGWCSWYHYYEDIRAATLRENFEKLFHLKTQVPTNVAVVDDGYMTAWGDWNSLKPDKFGADGLKGVANDIRSFGMRPGLWLAPFACDKHSQVAKQHPDWIIYNEEGRPANSSNCGKFFYGMDATHPKVREHVYQSVHRAVHEWGFDVLKIDFLYAACLVGNSKYDLSMTRAEAMHLALQTIRAAAGPDVYLIGCGCPIGSAIGYVDGMRVSADTGPTWYPAFPLPWWDNGTLPSLRSMVRNSMSRAPLGHRWWHNDPDCLLLGETTKLSNKEVASAASIIAMTCGMLLLSDDLTQVSPARMNIVSKIFPMAGATGVVLDLHNTRDGLPSLLRLWCTDRYGLIPPDQQLDDNVDHNRAATFFGRHASFSPDRPVPSPNERKRNCIHVCKGLGTWTLLSISNWLDEPTIVHLPKLALSTPPETGWEGEDEEEADDWDADESPESAPDDDVPHHPGYHVFAFWSSRYVWMPETASKIGDTSLSKRLDAHETELFHIRTVTPQMPQYIGSDIHFSCGLEVLACKATRDIFLLNLNCTYNRFGYIFVYVPRHDLRNLKISVGGAPGEWDVIGNTPGTENSMTNGTPCIGRIVRVKIAIQGGCDPSNGEISMAF